VVSLPRTIREAHSTDRSDSLAGMIHKVGLLPTCNHQQVPFAYKMYTNADDDGWQQSNAFKKAFSNAVDIEFLGVWQVFLTHKPSIKYRGAYFLFFHRDTVNAVGLIPRRLPFTTSNKVVKTFRHAVALDERRAKFKANLWNRPNPKEQLLSVTDVLLQKEEAANPKPKKTPNPNGKESLKALEKKYSKDKTAATDIDEVRYIPILVLRG
jgi:uncharacterized protein (DUF2235 family)